MKNKVIEKLEEMLDLINLRANQHFKLNKNPHFYFISDNGLVFASDKGRTPHLTVFSILDIVYGHVGKEITWREGED